MNVVIYARYSTDQQDRTSITGQVSNCEVVAARHGYAVVAHFQDEGITGTDDTRPGYRAMLAAAEAREFDGIIVDETSRLTRRAGELPRLLDLLAFRNQFLMDCNGFDSRTETAGLLASIYGGIDSLELRKIKERTHRGLRERSKAGFSAGGKTYGYHTVPTDPDDPASRMRHVIVEPEARIIVEIFQRYADGESTKAICDDLNRRGIPSPGSTWNRQKRRCRGWVHTALAGNARTFDGILRREMYIGKLIWNRTQWKKVPGTSKRKRIVRPASEWTVVEQADLRIIDDDVWGRVQQRLQTPRRKSARPKRPPGRPPRYLLSGILKCGLCGANFIMQDASAYGCSSHTNGGRHLCGNDIRVRRDVAEDALLHNVKEQLLSNDMIRYTQRAITAALREQERRSGAGSIKALESRQRAVTAKLERLADAIADLGNSQTLRDHLERLETEKAEIELALQDAQNQPIVNIPDMLPGAVARWREIVEDMAGLSKNAHATPEDVAAARDQLRALLGPVVLKPKDGVLWAHPSPNAKSLVETRLLGGLHINSHFCGSGGRI